MARSIKEVGEGDYVKDLDGSFHEIKSVSGVSADGTIAKPSEGGFSVMTRAGKKIGMMEARLYVKRDELPANARVVGGK